MTTKNKNEVTILIDKYAKKRITLLQLNIGICSAINAKTIDVLKALPHKAIIISNHKREIK